MIDLKNERCIIYLDIYMSNIKLIAMQNGSISISDFCSVDFVWKKINPKF